MEEKKTMQDLREYCNTVQAERKEEIKEVLESWLNKKFGYGLKPWRAIMGKKVLRPIPLKLYELDRIFTNVTKEVIKKTIEDLGFMVFESLNGAGFVLAIPKCKKGQKLTWAQKKIRQLNHDYSKYVANEKVKAQKYFDKVISDLCNCELRKPLLGDGYILFEGYKSGINVSPKCKKFINRLLRENKMEECFANGRYLGIRVSTTE